MFENNLANWFYIFGISYFVISFLMLIGLAAFAWILYRRLKVLQTKVIASILTKKQAAKSALSLTKILPFAITTIVNQVMKHKRTA